MNNYLISIVGPTGIGKTALSIKLAQHYNTQIISADSRQFYKEMQIGTAAPTPEELSQVEHHFIHHRSIEDHYSVGDFEKEAIKLLDQLFKSNNIVVMVGGSGLYVNAITTGLDEFPKIDPDIRTNLNNKLKTKGIQLLQEQLMELDIQTYKTIDLDNPHRVIRALEICIGTNKPFSSFINKDRPKRNFKTITIGLIADREIIYNRINKRVDMMITEGLLKEVKGLIGKQYLNALNTVGYKELFKYFNEEWSLDFAISEIKKNSRRYAKRQLTWFKKDLNVKWYDYESSLKNIIEAIDKEVK